MTNPFNPAKPVQTRDGLKARIICTDRSGIFSIVALIGGGERMESYTKDGKWSERGNEHAFDLINIPEERKEYRRVWRSVTTLEVSTNYNSTEEATRGAPVMGRNYLGIIEFVYTDDVLTATNFIPW